MTDQLISLALDYRDAAPWRHLADCDIFAVRLRNGEIGYCSVMGNAGAHFALGLYVGPRGWTSYLDICSMEGKDMDDITQTAARIDCMNCDLVPEDAIEPSDTADRIRRYAAGAGRMHEGELIPDFTRYQPMYAPGPIVSEHDEQMMEDALRASLFVAAQLERHTPSEMGFTDEGISVSDDGGQTIPFVVPSGDTYEIGHTTLPARVAIRYPLIPFRQTRLVEAIADLPRLSSLECRNMALCVPSGNRQHPCLPTMILAVDGNDGSLFATTLAKPDTRPAAIAEDFAMHVISSGYCPTQILVEDDETESLLDGFCKAVDIPIRRVRKLKHLGRAWTKVSRMFGKEFSSDKKEGHDKPFS